MIEIDKLKGIGDKTLKLFENLGISDSFDLLQYYPRDYEEFSDVIKISDLNINTTSSIKGTIVTKPTIIRRPGFQMIKVKLDDGSGRIDAVWFNSLFLYSKLAVGKTFIFRGKIVAPKGVKVLNQAKIYDEENYYELKDHIFPIYGLCKNLKNASIRNAEKQIVDCLEKEPIKDYLPNDLRKKRNLAETNFSYSHIHFPIDYEDMLFARKRLVYDEFFMFSLAINYFKQKENVYKKSISTNCTEEWINKIVENLPYKLTSCQEKAYKEIIQDLQNGITINRLIQGDVGSGKTIVAFLIMFYLAAGNLQSALMAPTEVLAVQHYNNITKIIEENKLPIKAVLLLGQTKKSQKKIIAKELQNGEALIAIGTHALFSEDVVFKNLSLVITDEQHRFGVMQRKALEDKSKNINIIVMSATPIPRTLSMLLYSDMQISVLDEKPSQRKEIKNAVVDETYREKAYSFIKKQIEEGHQAYIICSQVEESKDDDVESRFTNCENVLEYSKKIKKYFNDNINIQILHGKMKSKDKEKIMEDFRDKKIDILISTTVIEVGVDNPNATVMMVEDAQMFGLATLHQLRGRVGRGDAQSYCIFVNTKETDISKERLNILANSNDGFYIADEDLRLRGPGDIFGIRQSGDMNFKIADIYSDKEVLKEATNDAKEILKKDNTLSKDENKYMKKLLLEYINKKYVI